ncbi:MAG: hypothetical protein JW841_12380 [Deltaproteobacteria bacterium]|nr:hypothetical protein [Deltaproteobacteria bacterium]
MPKYKGSGVIVLREMLGERTELLETYLQQLSSEDRILFTALLPATKLSIEDTERLMAPGFKLLWPNIPIERQYIEFGKQLCRRHLLHGLYKKLWDMGFDSIVRKTNIVWRQYHDTGDLSADGSAKSRKWVFTLSKFPTISPLHFGLLIGFLLAAFESLNGSEPNYRKDVFDRDNLHVVISW